MKRNETKAPRRSLYRRYKDLRELLRIRRMIWDGDAIIG